MRKIISIILLMILLFTNTVYATEIQYKTGLKVVELGEKSLDLEKELQNRYLSATYLPSKVDYSDSPHLPPVGKQEENSCVGWAVGYYLRTFQESKDIGWNVKLGENYYNDRIFSPTFVYNQINDGVDDGATLEDAGDLVKNIGAATLNEFPYIPKDYKTKPSIDIINKAYPHRIREWYTLYTKKDPKEDIVRKTKDYLNTGDLVAIGIYTSTNWNKPYRDQNGNSIITKQTSFRDGHAVVVVGYDDDIKTPDGNGAFKIINSWGEEWGSNGFSYISYEAFIESIISGIVYTDLLDTVKLRENQDESLYKDLYGNKAKLVESTKVWKIKFSKPVDKNTIDNISIFKIDGENMYKVEVKPIVNIDDDSEVIITHDRPFNSGKYRIYIDDDIVSSKDRQKLKNKVKMNFIVD